MDQNSIERYKKPLLYPIPTIPSLKPPLPPGVRKKVNEGRSESQGGNGRCNENNDTCANSRIISQTMKFREEQLLYLSSTISSVADALVPPIPVMLGISHHQATITATIVATRSSPKSMAGSPHRRRQRQDDTFSQALARCPPPPPPALIRKLGSKELSGLGKVKVMLKVSDNASGENSPMTVDARRRQVTLVDPAAASTSAPEDRRLAVAAPKMFAFDAIFSDQESRGEVCATALTDIIHAVLNGADGCLFTFGHPRLGKTSTMIGGADGLGVVPSAISWLYRSIGEQKQRTGARFSVRVSAVEVAAPSFALNDLLVSQASESDQAPSLYLCEGALQSCCELRAPTPDKAAFFLDTALGGRTSDQSHLFYTLHVYQYSVAGKGGVAGGRSRLHLVDLGGCERGKGNGLPLSAIGNVLLAIFNGQKHIPHREHKLTQLLKECMGSLTCHAAMIAHVSSLASNYSETLTTIQLASRIHRMRRKRFKFMGAGGAAGGGEEGAKATGSSDVDPSSSEQSADTVIYVGPSEETDGEHPPVYIPSLNSGDNRCAMNKALRGSLAEQKLRSASKSVPSSPQRSIPEEKSLARKIPKPVSTRSSPARKPAEEQWVDGPRVLKSRVSEARNIHRSRDKKETWVDGPKGYGFMDTHKKNMIRQWVENQTAIASRQIERPRPVVQAERPSPSFPIPKAVPLEKLQCSGVEPEYTDDEEMEIEIVEIEEAAEPVPMQDCCLQVTEEDIALCMGELENPLPEVDQREHPLRILSQENLTVVSTFADSISITNDMEKLIPRNAPLYKEMNDWHGSTESPADLIARKLGNYEELNTLQDLYQLRKGEVKPVSRCQSMMFSEFITGPPSDIDVNSIASEPAYLPGENGKYCDNCKGNLEQNDDIRSQWQKQDLSRFQSFRKFTSISSLRHPDGASNPNLREMCSREPGNGAEFVDKKDEEEEITLPPPLQSSMFLLNRDGYENIKSACSNSQELRSSQTLDSTSGQYCRADVETLDRGWEETLKSAHRLRHLKRDQKYVKAELASRHRNLFSPFERGGLFTKRSQLPNITSTSKNKNIYQAF